MVGRRMGAGWVLAGFCWMLVAVTWIILYFKSYVAQDVPDEPKIFQSINTLRRGLDWVGVAFC